MKHPVRLLLLAAFIGLQATLIVPAVAQTYPNRPIRLIVPLAPGGTVDVMARVLQSPLEKSFGQSVVVDNRSGASGVIGANAVATAAPDGHTLLLAPTTFTITAALHPNMPFDPLKALRPVAVLAWTTQVIVANPKLPANDLRELAAFAKANPNKVNYSTPGATSQAHLLFELWSLQTGAKMQHVPYRGAPPALMSTVAGETQISMITASTAQPQIAAKTVKLLATGGKTREPLWPDSPTMAEAGFPDVNARQWIGLFAPGDTPDDVIDRLNAEINRALEEGATQARMGQQNLTKGGGTPQEFRALIDSEIKQWKDVARASNITMQ